MERSSALAAQFAASDPLASVFVSASAGSGKTKLLIDRLLRLMLPRRDAASGRVVAGAAPTRILCLTYTKAAAAEMAIRLNRELGGWVTLDDARLDEALGKLGALRGPAGRAAARALFAQVLDLPGGMRIQTIHAFCQSLLRRFPLEAAISPHFRLIEQGESERSLHEATDAVLAGAVAGIDALAPLAALPGFRELIGLLRSAQARLLPAFALQGRGAELFAAALGRALELAGGDLASLRLSAVSPPDADGLRAALVVLSEKGAEGGRRIALELLDQLALPPQARDWPVWRKAWLTEKMQPKKPRTLGYEALGRKIDGLADTLGMEAERVASAHAALCGAEAVRLTGLLLAIGEPALAAHGLAKQARGAVEFDDLIARTRDLLEEPGAAWVLFKLDGGLDHVLLDEVQDTSDLQWQIAGALTADFFAGAGQHDAASPRTVFAVGDFKQSIFGFQGAAPEAFRDWRERFEQRVTGAGLLWRRPELVVSFRSTQTVLDLVDRVFADPLAADGVAEPGEPVPRHLASRAGVPGRIELWPLALPQDEGEPESEADVADGPWRAPGGNLRRITPVEQLAEALAERIATRIGTPGAEGRPITAGDMLVLVRRRTALDRLLLRALKRRGVPVVNLLRAGLLDRPAVQDLLALCDVLLLPEDDLSLACVLTSPLGGLTDAQMMELAMHRPPGRTLWEELGRRSAERPEWEAARSFIARLLGRVDFDPPQALLSEALAGLGGRARLLRRLGPEAADAIDELMAAALAWSTTHPVSLQGFVHWLRENDAETRAEPEAAGDAVRLMTVHGSKGLQASCVILADTTGLPDRSKTGLLWATHAAADTGWDADGIGQASAELPLWLPGAAYGFPAAERLKEAVAAAELREYNRLLYVALTRAADELLVCGWRGTDKLDPRCWYARVASAFEATPGIERRGFGLWPGEALALTDPGWPDVAEAAPRAAASVPAPLPGWLGRAPLWQAGPPPAEPALPQPLAPSRPNDVAFGPAPVAESPLALAGGGERGRDEARRRGTALHALLQYLPDLAPAMRRDAARAWLASPGLDLAGAAEGMIDEALALIDDPRLAGLFGPGSRAEQALAGRVGELVIAGQVDRLAITPELVIVADFKTGRRPPERLDQVPVAYLRQMAAYRALLRAIHPGRQVLCWLIWTAGPEAMLLPDPVLDRHAPGAKNATLD